MSDTGTRLVYMANQILRNFAVQGDDAAAVATAQHIVAFWDPRMKAQLLAMDDDALGSAARVATLLRQHGTSPSPSLAATSNGGSDAG